MTDEKSPTEEKPKTEEKFTPRDQRIVKHVQEIAEAGQDIEKFAEALRAVRDDASLSSAHRGAIWKTLAQEAAQAYCVMVTGKQIDLEVLAKPN